MILTAVAAGVGALAFKLGMDAQRMKTEGKSNADVLCHMPMDAVNTMVGAVKWCKDVCCRKASPQKSPSEPTGSPDSPDSPGSPGPQEQTGQTGSRVDG